MEPRAFDLGVYLITDRACCGSRSVEEVVIAAIDSGVTLVQLRDKNVDARPMIALGRRLLELLRPAGIALIVNDRIDIARVLGADGVHIGQQDIPYPEARRLLGPAKIIGVSVGSEPEAREESARRRTGIPYSAGEVAVLQSEAATAGVPPLPVSSKPLGA